MTVGHLAARTVILLLIGHFFKRWAQTKVNKSTAKKIVQRKLINLGHFKKSMEISNLVKKCENLNPKLINQFPRKLCTTAKTFRIRILKKTYIMKIIFFSRKTN